MAQKFLYIIAVIILLVLGVSFALAIWGDDLGEMAFRPTGEFEEQPVLTDNAYADADMWFARAGSQKLVQWLPRGFDGEDADALNASAFFVHPTSYIGREHWNAPLDDEDSSNTAKLFIRAMASPFSRAGDVWVPRYRQAAFGAFLSDGPDERMAIELAYGDVEQAFAQFLTQNPDGPIILAGHSQGALHLLRLISENALDEALRKRIVAVYAIGWPISMTADLPALALPSCDSAEQTGCVIAWQSYAEPADYTRIVERFEALPGLKGGDRSGSPYLCFNPLLHATGGSAPARANKGTIVPDESLSDAEMMKGLVPARCDEKGFLLIGDAPDLGPYVLPGNNYHVYDIPLFWRDLRSDVETRVRNFGRP